MGEDERNDSLFIFDRHKADYIPVEKDQLSFWNDLNLILEDKFLKAAKSDRKSDYDMFIRIFFRQMQPAIRRMILGRQADNNWRKLHGLSMRRRYRK